MARLATLIILMVLVLSLSWDPKPSSPLTPGAIHINWSGWPFICKQTHRKLSANGGSQIVHAKYATPEFLINQAIAIAMVTILYLGLTRFAFKSFPRFTTLDILSMTVGVSIATAYFTANPDTFLWNLRFILDNGETHQLNVLQRPIWMNVVTCILIVIAGYSGSLILCAGYRRITNR